ncbi:glycosyltransferase family 2 protein [Bacillus salitolerans]|uniref:Glycosyltransferase family 2 protein n=1 Tax=Bacillus salitolerans TaxID=1437434 RepID=A0ABW4LP00_9BACI
MKLTVVIPTRNRVDFIKKLLGSITRQTLSNEVFEVIVVDNGSTDNTKEVVNIYKDAFPNYSYIYDDNPGLHIGRNIGMQQSKGENIVFADDDIVPYPRWLETIVEIFDNKPEVALVGGNNIPVYEEECPDWIKMLWEESPYGKYCGTFSLIDLGTEEKYIPSNLIFGCNYAIRKEVLKDIGGFNPDGMPEKLIMYRGDGESYVSRRVTELGYEAYFHPDASVKHFVSKERMSINYVYKRSYLQGISDSYTHIRDRGHMLYSDLLESKISCEQKYNDLSNASDIKLELNKGYIEGYLQHQLFVFNNPQLLSWILRKSYVGNNGILPI